MMILSSRPNMPRFYLRLISISYLLFAAVFFLIRVRPYDDPKLRKNLFSDGCPAPCFMGIQPDMPISDAVQLLKAHPWVEAVDNRTIQNTGGYIYWRWKPNAPSWIDTQQRGTIWVNNRAIAQIWLGTRYPLGEWLVELGPPDINILDDKIDYGHGIYQYRGIHAASGVVVESWQRCITADPYHSRVTIKLRKVIPADELASMMYLDKWTYRFNNCN